jgi:hypothetical protein
VSSSRRSLALVLIALLVASAVAAGSAGGQTEPVRQEMTVALADGDVRAAVVYSLPDRVNDLTVRLPALAADGTLVETRGFRQADETSFEWTGRASPSVTIQVPSGDRRVVTGDGWAMVVRPSVGVSYSFRGDDPGFRSTYAVDGEGYAADPLAYLGPHHTERVAAGGERTTFVVADGAGDVRLGPARAFLRLAPGRFDLGVRRGQTAAFVLPERTSESQRRLAGATAETSFWVGPSATRLDRTDTAFTHEYVHTRLGVVGEGSAAWLTEGSAEYFGHAFALNAGAGDYAEFRDGLAAARYSPDRTPVTLADRSTWRGTLAHYEKGAHVLAALDAEVRARTDGEHTLADVFAARAGEPFASHDDFVRTVRTVTGASLGSWLDRYVRGDDLPPLPEAPSAFVYGPDLDPDADGSTSAAERRAGTNPFVADGSTVTATATPVPTPSPTPHPTRTLRDGATPTPAGTDGSGTPTPTTGFGPGFGVPAAAGALAALALGARRHG